ncbi:MAG: PilC/PilY family type IV pilus protein [Desulfobacteraceae bacterium]
MIRFNLNRTISELKHTLTRSGMRTSVPVVLILLTILTIHPMNADAIDIADYPLDLAYKAASPIVMVVLDDSSSMDMEFITPEDNGTFENNYYVFPENPGDNVHSSTMFALNYMMEYERKTWKSQWHGYNSLYYNPKTVYTPWPDPNGLRPLPNADTGNPRSNPMNPSPTLSLNATYFSVLASGSQLDIRNSHYFILDDRDADGERDEGENVFLVNLSGAVRSVYMFSDSDNNERIDDHELNSVDMDAIPDHLRPFGDAGVDLQNFANWYSFYRKRSLTAKAAVARTLTELSELYIGFYSINKNLIQDILPLRVTQKDGSVRDLTADLLTRLYNLRSSGNTNLREGLDAVGKYYQGKRPDGLGPSPYAPKADGGECQRVYALAMTDGYWTETSFTLSTPDPDHDGVWNTLADVAFTYFYADLRPDLEDLLFPLDCDTESHQHMVTFSLAFGLAGTLNPDSYDPCSLENSQGGHPTWPDPFCRDCKAKIDDLWHAAANTHGSFFNASNPETLAKSLKKIFENIQNNEATAAPVTVSSELFYSSSALFQAMYRSGVWTGDVAAYTIHYDSDDETTSIDQNPLWRASEKLENRPQENRNIIGFDGEKAIAFNWNELSESQKIMLNQNKDLLTYIRGGSFPQFRKRDSKLGDIVHSSPLLVGNHVYVGANDGMLHAFNADNGEEAFAYIPHLVFPRLNQLSDKQYMHNFYVDQTPACSNIKVGEESKTWLVGGLGKGGKGYYCLDITGIDSMGSFSENTLKQIVKWEFKDDNDLGYTFSEPVIIRTRSQAHPFVVIFGNGYNSTNGFARLYILDVLTGELLHNLNTEKGDDNGLSTPIAIDVNNDGRADYIYAGDLKGHVWKWDIRSEDHLFWNFSYRDKDRRPAPLFKATANQSITIRPDVMCHPTRHGYMVCFGTGKFLGTSDLSTQNIQAIYGIWDYGDEPGEYLGEFDPLTQSLSNHPDSGTSQVRLVAQTITDSGTNNGLPVRTISKIPVRYTTILDAADTNPNQERKEGSPNPTRDAGWYLNLTASERVHQNVRIWNNVLIVLGRTPSLEPCKGGGFTMVYYLNPSSGGMVEQATCIDRPVPLNPPVIVTTPAGDRMIFKNDLSVPPAPDDGIKSGIYFWRQLF